MTIWVDADSCPRRIREIVARRANRSRIPARFVSGQDVGVRSAGQVRSIVTEGDADETIVSDSASGDLAVTRDIPLAARLVEKGVVVLNTRGDVYTAENVRERLSERDFAYELRSAAAVSDAARQHGRKEVKAFADAFDRELQKKT